MKKILVNVVGSFITIIITLFISLFSIKVMHYNNIFTTGIWINDIYCTGMTISEVSDKLISDYKPQNIVIYDINGNEHELIIDDKILTLDYTAKLNGLFKQHNDKWLTNLFNCTKYEIEPDFHYNEENILNILHSADWLNTNLYNSENTVSIIKNDNEGYILKDDTQNLLIKENACNVILNSIISGNTVIDLSDNSNFDICYASIPYSPEMIDTMKKYEGIKEFQSFSLTYDFGNEKEIIDAGIVANWMMLDNTGNILFDDANNPILDKDIVKEYVEYLASKYNTVGIERSFHTTSGKIITLSGGSYGNKIDTKAEYNYLLNAFVNKESGNHSPKYISEAYKKGTDDIGNTYVEVDKSNQMLYYYQEGKLKLSTPVVTGNTSRRMDTPSKICYVYFKQKNRVLRGRDYATPVKYWIAVDGHIGIHDASWRKEFGGEIYKTNGSHGCINTPIDNVTKLYDMVEIGTPVIIF